MSLLEAHLFDECAFYSYRVIYVLFNDFESMLLQKLQIITSTQNKISF